MMVMKVPASEGSEDAHSQNATATATAAATPSNTSIVRTIKGKKARMMVARTIPSAISNMSMAYLQGAI